MQWMKKETSRIFVLRDKAVRDRLAREFITVIFQDRSMSWNIDYGDSLKWIKQLTKYGERFTLSDFRDGTVLYDSNDGDTTKVAIMIHTENSKKNLIEV